MLRDVSIGYEESAELVRELAMLVIDGMKNREKPKSAKREGSKPRLEIFDIKTLKEQATTIVRSSTQASSEDSSGHLDIALAEIEKWKTEEDFRNYLFMKFNSNVVMDELSKVDSNTREFCTSLTTACTSVKSELDLVVSQNVKLTKDVNDLASKVGKLTASMERRGSMRLLLTDCKFMQCRGGSLHSLPPKAVDLLMTHATQDEILGCFPNSDVSDDARITAGTRMLELLKACKSRDIRNSEVYPSQ